MPTPLAAQAACILLISYCMRFCRKTVAMLTLLCIYIDQPASFIIFLLSTEVRAIKVVLDSNYKKTGNNHTCCSRGTTCFLQSSKALMVVIITH